MTAIYILGFAGILLLIGFLADYLFRKTSFPDILILLALGYLIGPVFHIVDPSQIAPASQVIGSFALVIILFNGGLGLEFAKVLTGALRATFLALLGFGASMAVTAAFAYYLLGWALMHSLLLGAIIGGTTSAIVIPLVDRARVPTEVSSVLNLESAFTDALVIVIALVILEVINAGETGIELSAVGQAIGIRFLIGIVIGAAVGFLWLWILTRIEGEIYDDILTLAMLFLLFFGVERINGSGAIFALVFGIILGNGMKFTKLMKMSRKPQIEEMTKKFYVQLAFLIKTFFFVYLGLMLTFGKLGIIVDGIVLSLLLLFARYIVVLLTSAGSRVLWANKGVLTTMLPRGLSAAVVAQMVVAYGISNASDYSNIVAVTIIATIVISSIGILIFARKYRHVESGFRDIT